MSVFFIRHSKLSSPFDNYKKLSLSALNKLSIGAVQPGIDQQYALQKIQRYLKSGFLKQDKNTVIYCSFSPRTIKTAQLIAKMLKASAPKKSKDLEEIYFRPKKLVSVQDYKQNGMNAVRKAVFQSIAENTLESESKSDLLLRLKNLQKIIKTSKNKNIIFITHGFFMRLLQIYFLLRKKTFSVKNLEAVVNYGYLEGFYSTF